MIQPAAAPASQPSLLQLLVSAEPWGEALYAALDGRARLALAHTSTENRQWVLITAAQATISLLAYGELSEAAWQRRFARAQQALAFRAEQGRADSILLLRLATPNPAALQALLTVAERAGSAVTELRVLQEQSNPDADPVSDHAGGVNTQWLRGLGSAYPNLRSLCVSHLRGCFPHPSHLPYLTELQVTLYPTPTAAKPAGAASSSAAGHVAAAGHNLLQLTASIAPYVSQLTTLDLSLSQPNSSDDWASVWPHLLTATTHSLQRLTFPDALSDEMVKLICKRAPALTHISCGCVSAGNEDHSGVSWCVRELFSNSVTGTTLSRLPQSPSNLLVPDSSHVTFDVRGEGLFESQTQRLGQWEFAAPCHVQFDLQLGCTSATITSALQQLAPALPAGAVVHLWSNLHGSALQPAPGALVAAAEQCPHITIQCSRPNGYERTPVDHMLIEEYNTKTLSQARWQRQTLHLFEPALTDFLSLPEMSNYRLSFDTLYNTKDIRQQWTQAALQCVQSRLQRTTFTLVTYATIEIESTDLQYIPQQLSDGEQAGSPQPASLRSFLQLLGQCTWSIAPECEYLSVLLSNWTLTPSLIQDLAKLPSIDFPCTLIFSECRWLPVDKCDYSELSRVVPTCYGTWGLPTFQELCSNQGYTVEHIKALCTGAASRGEACDRLRLEVEYKAACTKGGFTDAQRSQVAAHIDEMGLGRWVEDIVWAFRDPR